MTNARQARSAREKAAQMRAETARQQAKQRAIAIGGAVAAVIVIVVAVGVLVITAQQDKKVVVAPANLADGGMLIGKADAPVTIEIFEDFICPICGDFQQAYAEQFAAWEADGTAKVVYRPVAILDGYSSTDYSTRALNAFAAVLNTDPQVAPAYYELLMVNQPDENTAGLSDEVLLDLAEQAGADRAAIEPAVSALTYKDWIEQQNEYLSKNYQENGQVGTPTVVINGERVRDLAALPSVVAELTGTPEMTPTASATATSTATATAGQ